MCHPSGRGRGFLGRRFRREAHRSAMLCPRTAYGSATGREGAALRCRGGGRSWRDREGEDRGAHPLVPVEPDRESHASLARGRSARGWRLPESSGPAPLHHRPTAPVDYLQLAAGAITSCRGVHRGRWVAHPPQRPSRWPQPGRPPAPPRPARLGPRPPGSEPARPRSPRSGPAGRPAPSRGPHRPRCAATAPRGRSRSPAAAGSSPSVATSAPLACSTHTRAVNAWVSSVSRASNAMLARTSSATTPA
jgi:hypothetical protein